MVYESKPRTTPKILFLKCNILKRVTPRNSANEMEEPKKRHKLKKKLGRTIRI